MYNTDQYVPHTYTLMCMHSLHYLPLQLSHLSTRAVYSVFKPSVRDIMDTSTLPTVTQRSSPTAAEKLLNPTVKKSKPKPEAAKIAARKPTVKQVVAAAETYNVPKAVVAKAVAVDTSKVATTAGAAAGSSSDISADVKSDTDAAVSSDSSAAAVDNDANKVKV
jgi:hypothetical protein